jgi:hypothetical protein
MEDEDPERQNLCLEERIIAIAGGPFTLPRVKGRGSLPCSIL